MRQAQLQSPPFLASSPPWGTGTLRPRAKAACHARQPEAGTEAASLKGLWPPKLTAAQVQLQTRSLTPWESRAGGKATPGTRGAWPSASPAGPSQGALPFPCPLPPAQPLRPPHTEGGNKEHGTPCSGKDREQKKRLAGSSASWSGFPRPPLPPSAPCRPLPPLATVLLRCRRGSHQPRFHVGARRFGWEGVGNRGLRCQRPPPLEVGRERIHLCCLLFVCTCLAICLSLSCSPATGRLRVLGSRRLQLYARCHLEGAWL